jgi:hypothetical protein
MLRIACNVESPRSFAALQQTCHGFRKLVTGPELLPLWLWTRINSRKPYLGDAFSHRRCSLPEFEQFRLLARRSTPEGRARTTEHGERTALWALPGAGELLPWLASSLAAADAGTQPLSWLFDAAATCIPSALASRPLYARCWWEAAVSTATHGQVATLQMLLQHPHLLTPPRAVPPVQPVPAEAPVAVVPPPDLPPGQQEGAQVGIEWGKIREMSRKPNSVPW